MSVKTSGKVELELIKSAEMDGLKIELCAYVDSGTEYDKNGKPIDGFSHVLRITNTQTCVHGGSSAVIEKFIADVDGASAIASLFLEIDKL